MAMFCTRCSATHEQALHCPTCGNVLTYQESRPRKFIGAAELARGWKHTDWGRFFIGVGLAQGLFYGLYHLVKSIYLAVTGEPLHSESMPVVEMVCIQSLQLVGLLAGSVVAGVARRQAMVLGVYVGVANSILSLLLGQWPAYAFTTHWVYGQPFIQIVVGSIGALISSLIWKPLEAATLPETPSRMAKKLGAKRPRIIKAFVGPIAWVRVGTGVLFTIGGCFAAKPAMTWLVDASEGLAVDEFVQQSILVWELKGIIMVLGGILAGFGTPNGIKQGLVAGIVISAVLNVVLAFQHTSLEMVGMSTMLAVCLSLVGGWFGGQLFPPVLSGKRLKLAGPGMD
jgi:hypothetical protein